MRVKTKLNSVLTQSVKEGRRRWMLLKISSQKRFLTRNWVVFKTTVTSPSITMNTCNWKRCQEILGIQEGIMLFDQKILDCDSVGPGLGIWQTRVFCSVAARPFCADAASLKIKKFVFPKYIWLQDWEVFKNYIWFRRFSSPDEGGAVVRGRQQGRILHWICPGLVGQIL